MTAPTASPRIVATPGTLGGAPRIDGTRLSTEFIYNLLLHGDSREDIAGDYELDLADIDAAYDHERALRGES